MKSIQIVINIEAYADFHDKEWIEEIIILSEGTKMDSIVEEFLTHWWGTARAFMLPWLFLNGVYDALRVGDVGNTIKRKDVEASYLERNEIQVALWKIAESTY